MEGYEAPNVLTALLPMFELSRRDYSTDFSLFLASSTGDQYYRSYRAGIIFIACLFGGFLFLWGFILLWLKVYGRAVGCAAGYEFLPENKPSGKPTKARSIDGTTMYPDTHAETEDQQTRLGAFPMPYEPNNDMVTPANDDDEGTLGNGTVSQKPSRRERRTQLCFFFFSFIAFASIPLVLLLAFQPLASATADSDTYIAEARFMAEEASAAISKLSAASEGASRVVQSMTLDVLAVCPQISTDAVKASLGVDLESLLDLLSTNYTTTTLEVSRNISDMNSILGYFENTLDFTENVFEESGSHLYIVPTLLICLTAAAVFVVAGVCFSWEGTSTEDFQRILSYGILPLLILFSVACWLLAIGSAVATAIGNDACLSGQSSGSPNDTIADVLVANNFGPSSPVYKYATAYTGGCSSDDDPSALLMLLEGEVAGVENFIWHSLSRVDAVGADTLEIYCGGEEELETLVNGSRDLAKLLFSVREALSSMADKLACDRVSAVYDQAINKSICTDVMSATAWGFIFFLCLGVSTMGMITLRASWRRKVREEIIYDDEGEEAENMIVDEHEEYLGYISKYKHEWEEYQGVTPLQGAVVEPPTNQEGEGSKDSLEHSSSNDSSNLKGIETLQSPLQSLGDSQTFTLSDCESGIEVAAGQEAFDPYNTDTQSSICSEGSISFLSLTDSPKDEETRDKMSRFAVPPSLLHTSMVDDSERDGPDDISPPLSLVGEFLFQDAESAQAPTYNDVSVARSPVSQTLTSASGEAIEASPPTSNKPAELTELDMGCLQQQGDNDMAQNGLVGSLGTPISLSAPPTTSSTGRTIVLSPSSGSVKFQVVDDTPTSYVEQQVNHFSKPSTGTRPTTPGRTQHVKTKDLAAKFDSPPPHRTPE